MARKKNQAVEQDPLSKWRKWPAASPEERPKSLYVAETLPDAAVDWLLDSQGWRVVDVRVMPNATDADRAEGVKSFLEGVRVGSIEPQLDQLRYLELEAKICGLLSNKSRADDMTPTVKGNTLDKMLDFGRKRQRPE